MTRYRADIDGLRAVAVGLVVLYHAFPRAVPAGFIGVDVFFVISGYLISGIITRDLAAGRFSILDFYIRRIRRIFPALLLVMACTLAYGWLVLLPAELAALGRDLLAGAGFLSNIALWLETGYFDRLAALKPLLHLWSLGVEEQFYLAWPFLLALAFRARWRPGLFMALLLGLSFALNLILTASHPAAAFFLPFPRFWELLAGALLAWATRDAASPLPPHWRGAASATGLALILGGAWVIGHGTPFPGWAALLPVAGAVAVIAAGPGAWANRRLLSSRPAVFIGLISYPLYLWHWPLLSYATILRLGRAPTPLLAAALVLAALLLAWLTLRLVEKPLRFGAGAPRKALALLVLVAAVGLAGGTARWAEGFPARFPDLPDLSIARINLAFRDGIFRPTRDMRSTTEGQVTLAEIGSGEEAVLLTGDSVVFHYGPRAQALLEAGKLRRRAIFAVGPSCAPMPGVLRGGDFAGCAALPEQAAALIASQKIHTVVIGAFWQGYATGDALVERNGTRLPTATPAGLDLLYANLEDQVAALTRAGHAVHLLLPVPTHPRFDPQGMVTRSWHGFRVDPAILQGVPVAELRAGMADATQRLRAIAARTGAGLIDPLPDLCGPGPACSPFFGEGEPKFADDKHLRPLFAREHVTMLDGLLSEEGKRPEE